MRCLANGQADISSHCTAVALGLINRAYSESHEISNRREARRRFIESHKQNEEQYGGTSIVFVASAIVFSLCCVFPFSLMYKSSILFLGLPNPILNRFFEEALSLLTEQICTVAGTFGVGKTAHAHGTGPAQQRFGLSKGERLPLVGPMQQDRENKLQPAIGSGDRSVIKNIVEGAPVAEGEQTHILSEAPVVGKQGKTGVMHDEHRHMDGSLGEGSW